MNNYSFSCRVVLPIKCNHATVTHDNAINTETTLQPFEALSLFIKVLELDQSNPTYNSSATLQLHHTFNYAIKKFVSTICEAKQLTKVSELSKIKEVAQLHFL